MSVRTFNRRFREETGQSPGAWLLAQRLARARHLLEATDPPVDEVARTRRPGFGATLRQHLRATLGRVTAGVPTHLSRRRRPGGGSHHSVTLRDETLGVLGRPLVVAVLELGQFDLAEMWLLVGQRAEQV